MINTEEQIPMFQRALEAHFDRVAVAVQYDEDNPGQQRLPFQHIIEGFGLDTSLVLESSKEVLLATYDEEDLTEQIVQTFGVAFVMGLTLGVEIERQRQD